MVLATGCSDELLLIIEACLEQGAPRVYVHLDPPREPQDVERALLSALSSSLWTTAVRVRVTPARFGPRWSTSDALDWAFAEESAVVVLAEGVAPLPGCLEAFRAALEGSAQDPTIGMISGTGGGTAVHPDGSRWLLAPVGPLEGWATWRDRWDDQERNAEVRRITSGALLVEWRLPLRVRLALRRGVVQVAHGRDEFAWGWWSTLLLGRRAVLLSCTDLVAPVAGRTSQGRPGTAGRSWVPGPSDDGVPVAVARRPMDRRERRDLYRSLGLLSVADAARSIVILARRRSSEGVLPPRARRLVARLLRTLLLRSGPTLVIASSGRAGSSMLFESVVERVLVERARSPVRTALRWDRLHSWVSRRLGVFEPLPGLADLRSYPVIKTHAAPDQVPDVVDVRVIYTLAPAEHVLGSLGRRLAEAGSAWLDIHAHHLGSDEAPYRFATDPDRLLQSLDSAWASDRRAMSVGLGTLWTDRAAIAEWLGLTDLLLPERREVAVDPTPEGRR